MFILVDAAIIAIIVIMAIVSAKRGFARVAIETVGFIAAFFIAFTISTPLANTVYDKMIEPSIVTSVTEKTQNLENEAWDALPQALTNNAERFGFSREAFDEKISKTLSFGTETALKTALRDVIKPIIIDVLDLIFSATVLIVLLFLVKILARFINKLFSFSIIGKLNGFLGALVGILKGIVISVAVCLALSSLLAFSTYGFLGTLKSIIDDTVIYNFLINIF